MIQSILVPEGKKVKNLTSAELTSKKKFVWVDVEDPTKEDLDFLAEKFPIHPLARETVFESKLRPKVIPFDSHLLLVFHEPSSEDKFLSFSRLIIIAGKNFFITFHKRSLVCVDSLKKNVADNPGMMKEPSSLLYPLLDYCVDFFFPQIDDIDKRIDIVEQKILNGKNQEFLSEIFALKKRVLSLRKKIAPERDSLSSLLKPGFPFVSEESKIYFRDVYDHSVRIHDLLESHRDSLNSILEVHMSIQSNKMNEVMKILTLIATIMLPLTLITGFYGMNIVFPEVELFRENSYFFIFFLMLVVIVTLIVYFRKKKWF